MINIVIADEYKLYSSMLATILEQEDTFTVVGKSNTNEGIIDICQNNKTDILLLDLNISNKTGIKTLNYIKKHLKSVKVVILTNFKNEAEMHLSFSNGADGYLSKDTEPDMVINLIKCIYNNFFVVSNSLKNILLNNTGSKSVNSISSKSRVQSLGLDSIDLSILKLISKGKNNAEIAESINYSEGTIKNRISKMLSLTETSDRTQLIIFSFKNGIIPQ